MCIFLGADGPHVGVGNTNIFARIAGDWQWLAYEMTVEARGEIAMVLPLPVAAPKHGAALEFVSLEGCPDFFTRLADAFWPDEEAYLGSDDLGGGLGAPPRSRLPVQAVGQYEASYVASMTDFDRIDPRFRLSREMWGRLGDYGDWAFAVFQLRRFDDRARPSHPMVLRFVTRFPEDLFFPTVHLHDGVVRDQASFDHRLYFQAMCDRPLHADPRPEARGSGRIRWSRETARRLPTTEDAMCARPLMHDRMPLHALSMEGTLPNHDTWFRQEACWR